MVMMAARYVSMHSMPCLVSPLLLPSWDASVLSLIDRALGSSVSASISTSVSIFLLDLSFETVFSVVTSPHV